MVAKMIKKKIFGTCFFEYVEEYENEENAIKGERGTFIEVKVSNLKIERKKIERTNITKEDSDGSKNSFAEAKRPSAKETQQVSGAKV